MLGALLIVFREVLEAGLIIGIVLAATRGVQGRGKWISIGIAAGVVGACVVAGFAGAISEAFAGSGQELFNAAILGTAVIMLMWHNAWMARHGRELAVQLKQVGSDVIEGTRPLTALALVIGLAVLREGSEVVLFLYGVVAGGTSGSELLVGSLLGLTAGGALTILTYFGLLAIPSRYVFTVTTVLITLLAAGMAAQAVKYLDQAGYVTALGETLWDSSAWLPQGSVVGSMLHVLIGYSDHPTGMQAIVYAAVIVAMAVLMRAMASPHRLQVSSAV